jgi:hypothetical protein
MTLRGNRRPWTWTPVNVLRLWQHLPGHSTVALLSQATLFGCFSPQIGHGMSGSNNTPIIFPMLSGKCWADGGAGVFFQNFTRDPISIFIGKLQQIQG